MNDFYHGLLGPGSVCQSDGDNDGQDDVCEFGACCDNSLPGQGAQCIGEMLEKECRDRVGDPSQTKFFKRLTCTEVNAQDLCQEHDGACCDAIRGVCTDNVFESECNAASELCRDPINGDPQCTWHKYSACTDLDPACVPALGACCNPNTPPLEKVNVCRDRVTQADCLDNCLNGCPTDTPLDCTWFKGDTCDQVVARGDCEANSCKIPTVSQWGLVILTLFLLAEAKIYFGVRRRQTGVLVQRSLRR